MNEFYKGISEIIDLEEVSSSTDLHSGAEPWDSLALVSVIALIDECFDKTVDGQKLLNCKTVGDIESLLR